MTTLKAKLSLLLYCFVLPLVLVANVQEEVIALSGKGDDAAAVSLYESELSEDAVSVDVLRAVAGSYWRLRQFDTARALYRKVMQQQPALSGLSGLEGVVGGSEAETVVEEKGAPAVASAPDSEGSEEAVADAASEPEPLKRIASFQGELDALRSAYVELEEDRERQRRAVEARIVELMVRTEENVRAMDELQDALRETEQAKETAIRERAELEERLTSERGVLEAELGQIQASLAESVAAKQAADAESTAIVQSLEETLAGVRSEKESQAQAAAAREAELQESLETVRSNLTRATEGAKAREADLQQEITALAERESALLATLDSVRETLAADRDDAAARIAALDEQRKDLTHQLDTERIAARTRRDEYLEAEARLQASLQEQNLQVASLQNEADAFRQAAAQAEMDRMALQETLASEQVAHETAMNASLAAQASLESRLAEEEARAKLMEEELQLLQEQARSLQDEARDRFTALEQELAVRMEQLDAAKMLIERLESDAAANEAAWSAEQERMRQLREELESTLQADRTRFEGVLNEMQQKEDALRTELLEQENRHVVALSEAANQVLALEQALEVRDAEVAGLLEQLSRSTLQVALDEISKMEQDFAAMEENRNADRLALEARIAELEASFADEGAARAALAESLREESAERADLASRLAEREQELAQAESMLEEATAALNRQYDALRKQLDSSGVAVAVTEDEPAADGLVPLIGRIEAATESATLEVVELRRQFDAERQALTRALANVQAERDALAADFEKLAETTSQTQARQVAEYEARIQALEAARADQDARLQTEVTRMERALAGAQNLAEGLQADLEKERETQLRVLRVARDSASELNRRIAELESGVPSRETELDDSAGVSLHSESVAAGEQDQAEDILLAAIQAAVVAEDREAAVALYEQRDPAVPVSIGCLVLVGNTYRELGRFAEAYEVFSVLLERQPESLYAEQKVVMTLFDMGEYDKALDRLSGYENPRTGAVAGASAELAVEK